MIRYDLRCAAGHGFDGWFRSSGDFDVQSGRGLVACPACGSAEVEKSLMAPAVRLKAAALPADAQAPALPAEPSPAQPVALMDEGAAKLRSMLREIRAHVTANSEDVGDRFPEVARKMHAQEIEKRSVHGRASADEAKALADEGVEIHALPGFPDDLN